MKAVLCSLIALFSIAGATASADVLSPNQVPLSAEDSRALDGKIKQVTGRTAEPGFEGRNLLNASAQINCQEFSDGSVACKVSIEK